MKNTKLAAQQSLGIALLRITLGIIILVTWKENLNKGLYTADGLTGFLNWLFDANGNASSLGFYKSFLDVAVLPVAGLFGKFQLVSELILGIALILGSYTRLFGLAALFFFINLLLSYFGGHEWIWVYVLLAVASLTVALGAGGRTLGVDQYLLQKNGDPKYPIR